MKRFLIQLYYCIMETKHNLKMNDSTQFSQARLEAEIMRYVHSIEKGLSISNPRKGFGIDKIKKLLCMVGKYIESAYEDNECLSAVKDALLQYFEWNKKNEYTSEDLKEIENEYKKMFNNPLCDTNEHGGIIEIKADEFNFDISDVEKLFNTRHSIREFSGEEVTDEEIRKAIRLAQRSPSACNRQAVRVYSVSSKKYIDEIGQSLEGIGGFANEVDKFLLITAKQSAYRLNEKNQHIVSASMFAGYLTLSLHAYNIAACTIQRSLLPNKLWDSFRQKNAIPEDEQVVVMIGVGKYKNSTKVPISKRFDINHIYRNLDI